jgi:hypothetical protein
MSDWKTTELFIAYSNAEYSAYAVGVAIAAMGNRKEGGWTHASLDRLAKLARLDRRTANVAINELADSGELEYIPGTSRHNPSRYRIRVEILRDRGIDRFRCPLTMEKSSMVTMDKLSTVTMDESSMVTMEHLSGDHGAIVHATMEKLSMPSVKNRSIDQISDQSARKRALTDDASKDAGVDQTHSDDGALKAALEACRGAVRRSPGEEQGEPDTSVKVSDAARGVLAGWLEADDQRRKETMTAGRRRVGARRR